MIPVQNIQGTRRSLFQERLQVAIALHFLPLVFRRGLSPRRYLVLLRRLRFFLSRLQHNKFVRIGRATRLDLYVPSFPSPAFYTACRKFLTFGDKLPCTTVLISLTSACRFSCPHCYQKRDQGRDVALDTLLPVVRRLQDLGIAFFNLEGGEPFLVYDRLRQVCAAIDGRSEVWVNSTGDGMTLERLQELKRHNLTAVMFSLHSAEPARLNAFMGSEKGWESLTRGVDLCHQAEVPVAFNVCLGREGFYDGEFERIMDQAKTFGGCLIQLIKPKPAGGWLESGPARFSPQDLDCVRALVQRYNHDPQFGDYPAVSAQIIEEDPAVFGCTAGGTDRFYINAKGDVQPCEFLNISYGNIAQEEFEAIYRHMRNGFAVPGDNWLCECCAACIGEIVKAHGVHALPLSRQLSTHVTGTWDRGKPTRLYSVIDKLR